MRSSSLLVSLLAGRVLAAPSAAESSSFQSEAQSLKERGWPSVDAFLAKIVGLFPASLAINSACGLITAAGVVASDLFGVEDYENDPCGDVTFIFARGTCEPSNVGVMVGPWVARSIQEHIGSKTLGVQGLTYPAIVIDYLNGSQPNGVLLANMIEDTLAKCPNTKLVLGGYSQGSMVVHDAAAALDAATMSKIKAVVLFGDPYSHEAVAGISAVKVKKWCNAGDNICDNGPIVTPAHLTYAVFADSAGAFVASLVK